MAQLYEAHADAIHAYALRRSDQETADEVTARVFLVAWRRRESVPTEPLPWLYGVARRVLAEERRGAARRGVLRERISSSDTLVPCPAGDKVRRRCRGAIGGALNHVVRRRNCSGRLERDRSSEERAALVNAVRAALSEGLQTPQDDPAVRLSEYPPEQFSLPYPDRCSDRFTLVEVTMFAGRSMDAKRRL